MTGNGKNNKKREGMKKYSLKFFSPESNVFDTLG
jgi:hypothetical protein